MFIFLGPKHWFLLSMMPAFPARIPAYIYGICTQVDSSYSWCILWKDFRIRQPLLNTSHQKCDISSRQNVITLPEFFNIAVNYFDSMESACYSRVLVDELVLSGTQCMNLLSHFCSLPPVGVGNVTTKFTHHLLSHFCSCFWHMWKSSK